MHQYSLKKNLILHRIFQLDYIRMAVYYYTSSVSIRQHSILNSQEYFFMLQ